MKVYIAGKITGNGRYREEFAAAERKVRAMGHIPLNPAALPEGMEPADYMRICMAMLDSADAIAIMENWTESTGARIEFAYAQYVNKKVLKLWLMPDFLPKKDVEPEMDVFGADREPVVHTRWAHIGGDEWCCPVCGFVITTEDSWDKPTKKYCENCGAKMDGGADNEAD